MNRIGYIIGGSISEGFEMRIDDSIDLESIKTGKFVSIHANELIFFSMILDLKLECSNSEVIASPPLKSEKLLAKIIKKNCVFISSNLKPMLMLNKKNEISKIKTVPSHFSEVFESTKSEIEAIFGNEIDPSGKFFNIGQPIELDTKICIDLEKLSERNSGIFGKTGTGKTFLARLILSGLIKKNKAVSLIFDMHSEYGIEARKENSNNFVKGLKTLFSNKVSIFTIDFESTKKRGVAPDVILEFSYQDVEIEDIISLQLELNLHSTALEASYLISNKYKNKWLEILLEEGHNAKELADKVGAHPESIAALYRKLKRIEKLKFFKKELNTNSAIDKLIEYLDKEINVIIEFGTHNSSFCYLLIANIITRRIHSKFIKKTEAFLNSKKIENEPKQLVIVIEEAHKFLNKESASQTIFGKISREMRKYFVSLLIIDQRPSEIDPEVLSQIGTKIIAQLSDEKDIQSLLSGSSNFFNFKNIISALDSKQEILIIGHAIPMPIVIKSRSYDEKFYSEICNSNLIKNNNEIIDEIY